MKRTLAGAALVLGLFLITKSPSAAESLEFTHGGFSIEVKILEDRDESSIYSVSRRMDVSASQGRGFTYSAAIELDGIPERVWATDLDSNGSPEFIAWVRSHGSGGYGTLIFIDIRSEGFLVRPLPTLRQQRARGYLGHDQFRVGRHNILRTFPVYGDGDPNCCPSGGQAVVEYRYDGTQIFASGSDSW